MKMILAIAAGGALGAVARHYVSVLAAVWFGHGFPIGTLTVNIVGSFAMGVLIETMALVWSTSGELRAFLTVGVLGAFTTFSTFSLDVATLAQRGEALSAALYIVFSVSLSIGALFGGLILMRAVLT